MGKCTWVRENLSLYYDGMLDKPEERLVKRHIEVCTYCYSEYEDLTRMSSLLSDLGEVEAPDNFSSSLVKQIGKTHRKKQHKVLAIAASFFVAVVLSGNILIYTYNDGDGATEGEVIPEDEVSAITRAADNLDADVTKSSEGVVDLEEYQSNGKTDEETNDNNYFLLFNGMLIPTSGSLFYLLKKKI